MWPPVIADVVENTGDFSTISRDDASLQWAFKNRPLYYYQGDASEGEINGEGIGEVWYVARPNPFSTSLTEGGALLVGSGTIRGRSSDSIIRNDYDGFTLYTFRNDGAGVSVCNDGCASNWPPLFADKGAIAANGYAPIERDDGSTQWAYNDQPLYFYQGDSAPGESNGDGVGGAWNIATPDLQAQDNPSYF